MDSRPPRILVVDDEPAILMALQLALEDQPWQLFTAPSAERALALCEDTSFDAYVVDKNLPGASGIALVRKLRERSRVCAIVVITGFASSASAMDALNLGVDAYLEKPFYDIFNVAAVVQRALGTASHRRASGVHLADRSIGELPALRLVIASPSGALRANVTSRAPPTDSVVHAASPAQAVDAVRQGAVDLVVIDSEGLCVTEVVEALRSDIGVVVIGPRPDLASVQRLIELRVKAFIDEPMGTLEFASRLAGLLDAFRVRKMMRSAG